MRELRGAAVAQKILAAQENKMAALAALGITPCLGVVRIGQNAADIAYERGLIKRFDAAGARVKLCTLAADCTQAEAAAAITALNADKGIHGILLFMPLPQQLDAQALTRLIAPTKDVDGASALSAGLLMQGQGCFAPCTAAAVLELMEYYDIAAQGKNVCIIGRSSVVGKPLAMLLLQKNATVTVCHTKTADIAAHCRRADIIIAAAGCAAMLTPDMLNNGCTLIDVGMNSTAAGLCGDISPAAYALSAAYTPVPGGVGAVTTAVLFKNTVAAAAAQANNEY